MFQSLQNELHQSTFWLAVGKVIWIDVLLSGDNALVIAMACRGLSLRHRVWGMFFGAGAAVAMRILFTGVIAQLMVLPYLKIAGGVALIYVAAKMCLADDDGADVKTSDRLLSAIVIVVMADIVMSLDNMIAVAAVAQGSWLILSLGLMISIPMIVTGATIITFVLERLPVLVWAGAALLGWIAGDLIAADPVVNGLRWPMYPGLFGSIAALGIITGWRLAVINRKEIT